MNTFEQFVKILKEKASVSDIKSESELRSLGIDSLDLVEIIMDIEEQFGIQFENDELNKFVTVDDVVKAIESKK
ncbi:MAG: phosphopantetheine-binding protein [Bacilli bacterium]|nr:phosphopantetheine-binding protein [Bacilli bacterium]